MCNKGAGAALLSTVIFQLGGVRWEEVTINFSAHGRSGFVENGTTGRFDGGRRTSQSQSRPTWNVNKSLYMVFQAILSKFLCAIFQKPLNISHFVPLFLADENVVDGFVIFHTKLSTPRLGSFICSSLILQGSCSDHCNLKKKRKMHSSIVCESWSAPDRVSHGLRKEKVGRSAKL
jgi:hypothetical protein